MPKKESNLSVILGAIPVVLTIAVLGGLAFVVYLWRFSGYEATAEEIFSTSNMIKTIAILVVIFGVAFAAMKKDSDDDK